MDFDLNHQQQLISDLSPDSRVCIRGKAGTGKTTAAVSLLNKLSSSKLDPGRILVITPQRSLGLPYQREAHSPHFPAGGTPTIVTVGGLAQRTIRLFWPLIRSTGKFTGESSQPIFLTMETAQYFMSKIVEPLQRRGYFEHLVINPNRLYAQILDNMNKAALIGMPHTDIAPRLSSAWIGKPDQIQYYLQAQECVNAYRNYCYANSLLDFSLQFELFQSMVWKEPTIRNYLQHSFDYLIYDNFEEDAAGIHDLILDWLPALQGFALITDSGGGFRTFLGADPFSAQRLVESAEEIIEFDESIVSPISLENLGIFFSNRIHGQLKQNIDPTAFSAFTFETHRFYPDMITAVVLQTQTLMESGVGPGEIVIIAPYLSDSLRFSLQQGLEKAGIPNRSHRPSQSILNEPIVRSLLTLAKLVHPEWKQVISAFDVRWMFASFIEDVDVGRTELLANQLFQPVVPIPVIKRFSTLSPGMRDRITFKIGNRADSIIDWIEAAKSQDIDLDVLFSRFFGDVLSQPGFTLHKRITKSSLIAALIESVQHFRTVIASLHEISASELGENYVSHVESGILSSLYLGEYAQVWPNEVLLSPAFSYLMQNHAVQHQIWLDVGNESWWERVYQPLTHPYVLSRNWQSGNQWTDKNETAISIESLSRIVSGLINRSREAIHLHSVLVNDRGAEERGLLLQCVQSLMKRKMMEADRV